ncbi:hypothetical protein [Cognatishimia sp.]|uniref:MOSC domain-containing protein n=1 Tax=Cognatishimia sp. TaxID=2211648 RepID=UPI0035189750
MHITRSELDDLLPEILAAPKDGAAVSMLCTRPARNQRAFPEQVEFTKAQGIPGERWSTQPWLTLPDGSPDPQIQVCILNQRVLDAVWRDRENVAHPGDTFILDMDLGYENLPVGQLLQVGEVVLRVSEEFNTACAKWKVRYGRESFDWINDPANVKHRLRGILCSIEKDGVVKNGDRVTKLSL